jgi:DNA-binding LytR/AlgR family response regulator
VSATAILVDDESHLVEYLARMLSEQWPELQILGSAANGRDAVALASETRPDITFLDIHMPGMSGLQVAEALPTHTRIVFVTAFEEFAVEAFRRAAIDYLLKPVTPERLAETVSRLKDALRPAATQPPADAPDRDALLQVLREVGQPREYLQWLRTGFDDTTRLLPVQDVIYFEASQKYTSAITRDGEHLLRRSIRELAEELDPNIFWQIHRGIIVRVDQVTAAKRDLRGRYTLSLRDHPAQLRSSQSYGYLFKQM